MVRATEGVVEAGLLSFCARTGRVGVAAQTSAANAAAMKIGAIFFIETDCAGEKKSCLAQAEFDVAVVVRHRHRGAAVAHVADHAPPFAERFHVRIPKLAHRNFLRRRSRDQPETTVDRQLQSDSSLPRLELIGSAGSKLTIKENVAR